MSPKNRCNVLAVAVTIQLLRIRLSGHRGVAEKAIRTGGLAILVPGLWLLLNTLPRRETRADSVDTLPWEWDFDQLKIKIITTE
jgi:hypothetical protein